LTHKVQHFRESIGMADFQTEPHVSISATLYDLKDMDGAMIFVSVIEAV